jgi:hypothetical protein
MSDELSQIMEQLGAQGEAPAAAAAAPQQAAEAPNGAERVEEGGFSLPPQAEQPQAAPPPEMDLLQRELEDARKRLSDTQQAFHQERAASTGWQHRANQLEQIRQQEAQIAQQAQNLQPPSLEDPSVLHEKPEALRDFIQKTAEWGYRNAMAQIFPYVRQFAEQAQVIPSLAAQAEQQAQKQAKELVSESLGFDDFDEHWPEIHQSLSSHAGGAEMLRNPEILKDTYLLLRSHKGLPLQSSAPTAPVSAPTTSSVAARSPQAGALKQRLDELSPMAAEVAKGLGIGKIQIDGKEDLARVGLLKE